MPSLRSNPARRAAGLSAISSDATTRPSRTSQGMSENVDAQVTLRVSARSKISVTGTRSRSTASLVEAASGVGRFELGGLLLAPRGDAGADLADAGDVLHQCRTGLFSLAAEPLESFDLPVADNHRLENLVVVNARS